jgi:hypothetical protein
VRVPLALLLLFVAQAAAAGVEIRTHGDRLDLVANAAPLGEVLARLSQQSGMKVEYDGAPPPATLTISLLDRTPLEAVLGVFEGLGVNYALRTDRTGTRVDLLLVSGTAGRSPSTAARFAPRPQPEPPEADQPEDREEPPLETPHPPVSPPLATAPRPVPGPGRPDSPFRAEPAPLTFPTPVPPAPSPSPSPGG